MARLGGLLDRLESNLASGVLMCLRNTEVNREERVGRMEWIMYVYGGGVE